MKVLVSLMALAIPLSLAACGSERTVVVDPEPQETMVVPESEPDTIVVPDDDDPDAVVVPENEIEID